MRVSRSEDGAQPGSQNGPAPARAAAAGRAKGATSRPARSRSRRRTDRHAGKLVLIGGAIDPTGRALGSFIDLARTHGDGKIVGLTTASSDPRESAKTWLADFRAAGVSNVEFPIVEHRNQAQDRQVAAMLRSASGIFLGGGDQVHLVATLGGSRVERAIREAYADGTVVCGTSAGAAALTETILAGGEPDDYGEMVDLHLGPGFGMLGFRAVIDTHFAQRRRLQRLFMVVAQNPELMGLGIDEDTALVVQGHLGEVVGRGSLTFVDGRGVRFDNADECLSGRPLTLSYLRVGIVGAGYTFNLRERELEILVQAREQGEAVEVLGQES
jgi:cyanophycinase